MSIGVSALFNFIAALLQFVSNIFSTVGDAAELSGDPEVATPVLLVVVWCLGSGHYVRGFIILFAGVFIDLVLKELGINLIA